MVRFGAKKEEFIPPFLFYIILNYQFHSLYRKKKRAEALLVYLSIVLRLCVFSMHFTHFFPVNNIEECLNVIGSSVLVV